MKGRERDRERKAINGEEIEEQRVAENSHRRKKYTRKERERKIVEDCKRKGSREERGQQRGIQAEVRILLKGEEKRREIARKTLERWEMISEQVSVKEGEKKER